MTRELCSGQMVRVCADRRNLFLFDVEEQRFYV